MWSRGTRSACLTSHLGWSTVTRAAAGASAAQSRLAPRSFLHHQQRVTLPRRRPAAVLRSGTRSAPVHSARNHRFLHCSAPMLKIIPFNLADIGEAIAEVELVQWFVEEGQEVNAFDQICIVESDKATTPITSQYDGKIVKLYYEEGDMAKTGLPLIDIDVDDDEDDNGSDAPVEALETATASKTTRPTPSAAGDSGDKLIMTPAVRRLIREHGIDLTLVHATGKNNRVLKEDVLHYIEHGSAPSQTSSPTLASMAATQSPPAEAPSTPTPTATPPRPAAAAAVAAVASIGEDRVVAIKGLQRTMVKTMEAAHKVPTFGYADEVVMDQLVVLRSSLKAVAADRGARLSYMPFMMKAASLALLEYPVLNSHVNADCTEISFKAAHNIALAMDTPNGLLVPNIKNVESKTVFEIAVELNELQELGMEGRLGAEHLKGGTFTLSNIGVIGGTYMRPIIVVPQVVIGALGGVKKLPRYNDDNELVPTMVMEASWSADHRVIDGVTVAKFSNLWKKYLENPSRMLLDLR